jgi:spore coat protein A
MATRRDFLKIAAATSGAALLCGRKAWASPETTFNLAKFIQPLPNLGPTGIPVATPNVNVVPGADFYKLTMGAYEHQFHPDLPKASRLWGYADGATSSPNFRYLGGAIVAQRDRPVIIKAKNNLQLPHPLPVDETVMGACDPVNMPHNKAVIHLHGGFTPWNSDGGPHSWFSPDGKQGTSFQNGTGTSGEALYYYPNQQSARLLWYHDHALGTTRLNAYAGLASAYILRDDFENSLIAKRLIPSREIPLIIQDKSFVTAADCDAGYVWGQPGDLWYSYINEDAPAIRPSLIPEFFGEHSIVNGAAYPYVELEQRHYRFRILNAAQARFYNLQLYYADSTGKQADLSKPGPRFVQIGTEGGFLPFPVAHSKTAAPLVLDEMGMAVGYNLLLAPAERADIVVDFSNVPAGAKLILHSDAPAPFPMGGDDTDFDNDLTGPNTRTLMQIRVVQRAGAPDPVSLKALESIALNNRSQTCPVGAVFGEVLALKAKHAVRTRDLTLNEDVDEFGRLRQTLGTNHQTGFFDGKPFFGMGYEDAVTESPTAGDVEIWRIFNLTADTHPIHFHLVNVQVLGRQPFDVESYDGKPTFTGPERRPDLNECGWKETVRMNPGECTTVIMKFELPRTPFAVPPSNRTGGHEYVWHCHILEHEEHDMMRPLIVKP